MQTMFRRGDKKKWVDTWLVDTYTKDYIFSYNSPKLKKHEVLRLANMFWNECMLDSQMRLHIENCLDYRTLFASYLDEEKYNLLKKDREI